MSSRGSGKCSVGHGRAQRELSRYVVAEHWSSTTDVVREQSAVPATTTAADTGGRTTTTRPTKQRRRRTPETRKILETYAESDFFLFTATLAYILTKTSTTNGLQLVTVHSAVHNPTGRPTLNTKDTNISIRSELL